MTLDRRLFLGGILNLIAGTTLASVVAGRLMRAAESATGAEYAWPQISFMSAYPDHVRNGYLMFVLAIAVTVILFSGVSAHVLGASPGRALFGIHYVNDAGDRGSAGAIWKRCGLILAVMLFILLAGPVLGFVFGVAADPASAIALFLGFGLALWALVATGPHAQSNVDRASGLRCAIRPKKEV